MGFVNRMVI